MTTAVDDYASSQALDAYFSARTARQIDRLWANEKHGLDADAVGYLELFTGPGPNPMALDGASTSKVWLRVDPDVTANAGTFRVYQSGTTTDPANWPLMTPALFFTVLVRALNASQGWSAASGTASRATFATSTVTTEQLAQRVKALIDDLTTLGLLGD
jgi:hypothetical protein